MTVAEHKSDFEPTQGPHISSSYVSYVVSIERTLNKNGLHYGVAAPHYTVYIPQAVLMIMKLTQSPSWPLRIQLQ